MQELSQLQTVVGNTNVVLSMDNHRELNMDGIIEEVRQEYEAIAQRSKAEVDAMYQGRVSKHRQDGDASLSAQWKKKPKMSVLFSAHQYQDLQNMWVNQREQVRNSYQEIQELIRQIQRLQQEIEIARRKVKLMLSSMTKLFKSLLHGDSVQCNVAYPLEANLEMTFSLQIEADLDFGCLHWDLIWVNLPSLIHLPSSVIEADLLISRDCQKGLKIPLP